MSKNVWGRKVMPIKGKPLDWQCLRRTGTAFHGLHRRVCVLAAGALRVADVLRIVETVPSKKKRSENAFLFFSRLLHVPAITIPISTHVALVARQLGHATLSADTWTVKYAQPHGEESRTERAVRQECLAGDVS